MRIVWLENHFSVDGIITMLESCDKECASCEAAQRLDCMLEMRESIHGLALTLKELVGMLIRGVTIPTESHGSDAAKNMVI